MKPMKICSMIDGLILDGKLIVRHKRKTFKNIS